VAEVTTLAAVATMVSAVAGGASALASWKSALASSKAARESRDALAYATRPYLTLHTVRSNIPDSTMTETVEIRNTSGFPADDVRAVIHDSNGCRVGSGELPSIEGKVPNSWAGEAPLRIELTGLAPLQNVGDTRAITATIRASDRQHILQWEQTVKVVRKVVPPQRARSSHVD
jgi:hypothetical protein